MLLTFSQFSLAASKECDQFLSNPKGKSAQIGLNKLVKKLSEKKLAHYQGLVKDFLKKCKTKGKSPYYCLGNKKKKTKYCLVDKLRVFIAIEDIKRKQKKRKDKEREQLANNKRTKPNTPSVSTGNDMEKLGRLLLKSNYIKVNQAYLAYYSKGPTGKDTSGRITYGGIHPGIDYKAPKFTRVTSPVNGVIHSVDATRLGRLAIKTEDGKYFILLHMSEFSKTSGSVKKGDYLGKTGDAGAPGAPHLHVEYRKGKYGASWYFKGTKDTPKDKIDTDVNIDPVLVMK